MFVKASIGIATGDRTSADELLRDADIAMYRAKWDGKNRYVVFESEHAGRGAEPHGARDGPAARARATSEFFLVYQPTFDLTTMRPTGVEA